MRRVHSFSRRTQEAVQLLGSQIRVGRTERRMTLDELAERVGVTTGTLRRLEQGDPTVALGIAVEAAVLVGLPIFGDDETRRRIEGQRLADRLAVLPSRVRTSKVTDEF